MREDNYQAYGSRSQKRQRKKSNKVINISIAVVALLILVVGGKLLFGGNSTEPVATDDPSINEDYDVNEKDEPTDVNEDASGHEEKQGDDQKEEQSSKEQERPATEPVTTTPVAPLPAPTIPGQWQPIGTVQPEPFYAIYDKEHVNWEEMTRAFQYATGLSSDMVIWWVKNGGNHQSAVGIVSTKEEKNTPYEVRIEWVTNQGWKPVNVTKLENNNFLGDSASTSGETEQTND